jgi:rod shape-determining protein MreD
MGRVGRLSRASPRTGLSLCAAISFGCALFNAPSRSVVAAPAFRSYQEEGSVRFALAIVIPLAAALLQGSVVPFVSIAGARPNLPVLAAASWSVAAGAREAVWWAFVGGLAADLLSGGPPGALALASLLPVAAIGLGESTLRPRSVVSGAVLVGVATLGAGLLYLLILLAVGQPLADPVLLAGGAAAGAIYNGILAIATYPIARWVHHAGEKQASFGL